jgi:four helix bundle protein
MNVTTPEDLQIWQRSRKFAQAVFAITRTAAFDCDLGLREQLNGCADSILANIAEGFAQSSDRAFARYLVMSRGSILEARAHLVVAADRNRVSVEAVECLVRESREIEKMVLALIRHLHRSNRKNRI